MSATPTGAGRRPLPDRPRLLSLRNGEKAPSTFSREEMEGRLSRLRAWMREASVDACLFTSIHNVNYFADYVYCSFGRHYGLVVDHDAHTLVNANLDYGRPWRRSRADALAYTDWNADNFFVAVRSLSARPGAGSASSSITSPAPHAGSSKRPCPTRVSSTRAARRCASG